MRTGIIFISILLLSSAIIFGQEVQTVQQNIQSDISQEDMVRQIQSIVVGSSVLSTAQLYELQRQAKFGVTGATTQPSGTTKIISNIGNKSSFHSGGFTRNSGGFTKASDTSAKINSGVTNSFTTIDTIKVKKPVGKPAQLGIERGKITIVRKPPVAPISGRVAPSLVIPNPTKRK